MKHDLYRVLLEWMVDAPGSDQMSLETLESKLNDEFSLFFDVHREAEGSLESPEQLPPFYEEFGQGARTLEQLYAYQDGVLSQFRVIGLHDFDRGVYGFINLDLETLQESIEDEFGETFEGYEKMSLLGFDGPDQMFATLKTFQFGDFTVVI